MAKTKKLPPKKSVKKNTKPTKKTAKIVKHNVSKNKKPIAKKVVKHSPKKTTQTLHNVKSTKTSKPISKKTASKSVNVSKKPAPVKTTKVSKPMTNKKVIKQKVVEELPLELKKTPKGKKEISIETKQLLQEPLVVTGDDIISIIRSTIAEIKEGKSGRKTITRKKLFGLIKTYVIDDETRSKIIDEFILANVELTGTAPTYDETTDTSIRDLINATSISKGTSSYSQRISNSYSYIASNIQGSNLLTPEEEKKYSKMILSDDPSIKKFARHKIILSNLKLVASYVNMYSGHGIDNNELFLEGVTGLNKALDKYD
jgi:DNA-directed RNA polymerase sigma subunit (sigma70/sigma32)